MDQQPPETRDSQVHPRPDSGPTERRVSRRTTIIGSLIAVLVVLGLGWLAWDLTHSNTPAGNRAGAGASAGAGGGGRGAGPGGPRSPAVTVGVATAERADLPVTIEAIGTVTPMATVRVRPQVSGTLKQVLYSEGQMVQKGQVLAVIDPSLFEMALQQATGQRMKDEAQLAAARVTLERYRTLLKQDSIARQDVDTQDALVKQLEATVVVDKANEGTARLNLGYTRIVAPITGRVGLRPVDIGNIVSTSDTNGVAVITQLSPIDVTFAIPQDQASLLQQQTGGAPMEATALDRTRATAIESGVFTSLDNQIDTQTGTVHAKARFPNAKLALFPSQFVNVRLKVQTIRNAVVVPVAALRHGNSGDYVFVLKDDRTVAMRNVKAGQATVDKVQIADGVQVGEHLITEGADRLRDGSRVILPGDAPRGQGAPGGAGGRRQGGGAQRGASAAAPGASADAAANGLPGGTVAAAQPTAAAQQQAAQPPVAETTAATPPAAADKPTPEQRQRMLDGVASDPQQLARRKQFLEALDRGDPQAIERWRAMQQRRAQGGGTGQ